MLKRISHTAELLSQPVINELPLFVVWLLAMCIGGVGDITRLADIEFPTLTYTLGLLRIVACGICLSALAAYLICVIARLIGSKWLRWGVGCTALLMIGTYVFIRHHYGSRLTPEIATVITETNRDEATEYLATYLFSLSGVPIIIILIVAALAFVFSDKWWHQHPRRGKPWHTWAVLLLGPLVLLGTGKMMSMWPQFDKLLNRAGGHYETFGVDALTNVLKCQFMLKSVDEQTIDAIKSTKKVYDIIAPTVSNDSLTIVLVIGESYIKSHASLYGYGLPTTPLQQSELDTGRLVVFDDIITPYHFTNMAMRDMFSLNNEGQGQLWSDSPLFPAIFKHAGYHVDMWDNQREFMQGSINTRGLNGLMYHPEIVKLCYSRVNNRNFEFDHELVENYAEQQDPHPHQLVMIHLRGQHIKAERRYPHSGQFSIFTPNNYHRTESFITPTVLQEIAHYDNATRYNDYVLKRIFDVFSERQAIIICLSDHGDEVYDYRNSIGRLEDQKHPEKMIKYQHDIPFTVWCSPSLLAAHPEMAERLGSAADRPGTIDNLGHMLLGLSGIRSPYYNSELDLLSPAYKCPKRIVRGKYDYDQLTQQVQ